MTTKAKPINHGTTGGYSAHRHRGETACRKCKDAWNAYLREYHARKPPAMRTRNRQMKARGRALTRLKNLYPGVYERLLLEETRKEWDDNPSE